MIRKVQKEDFPALLEIARIAWKPVFDEYKNEPNLILSLPAEPTKERDSNASGSENKLTL